MIRVRVGIVVWNTAELLERCLAALPAALAGMDASIVVVDNNSGDGSADVASRHMDVTVIRNDVNVGYSRAMNQALEGADVDAMIALNPDTEPPPGSLADLVGRLLASPDVGLVSPRLISHGGRVQHSAYRFPSLAVVAAVCLVPARWQGGSLGRRFWLEGFSPHDRNEDIDWVIGAVHVFRPSAIPTHGPYDERWFMYVEDLDLCWRLAQAGWRRRLESDVTVYHVGNAAGELAWGRARVSRWQWATYDWYGLRHGRRALRIYAGANGAGCIAVVLRLVIRGIIGRGFDRSLASSVLQTLPIHWHVFLRGSVPPTQIRVGPSPPDGPPSGPSAPA